MKHIIKSVELLCNTKLYIIFPFDAVAGIGVVFGFRQCILLAYYLMCFRYVIVVQKSETLIFPMVIEFIF